MNPLLPRLLLRTPAAGLLVGLLLLGAPAAEALSILAIEGVFSGSVGGANTSYPTGVAVPGFGTGLENQARWGRGMNGGPNSGLGFTPNVAGLEVLPETEFVIGRVRHFNHPVQNPATATWLAITLSIVDASPASTVFPFLFTIDETANDAPCAYPGSTMCPDRIANTSSQSGVVFSVAGQEYTLQILGWRAPTPAGDFATAFISEEGGVSEAYLVGKITAEIVLPEPASVLLLGAGLSALAAIRRSRRA